jgi:tellurite resistance protein
MTVNPNELAQVHASMLEILCCVIAADGQLSRIEGTHLREAMKHARAPWDDAEFKTRVKAMIARIDELGFDRAFSECAPKVELLKRNGKTDQLRQYLTQVALADGISHQRETAVVAQIQKWLA